MKRFKAYRFKRLAVGAPAAWLVEFIDGRYIYIHYRNGLLTAAYVDNSVMSFGHGREILADRVGRDLDSFMTSPRMMKLTADVIDWRGVKGSGFII